jgi:iron complex outermembrane recepter protein
MPKLFFFWSILLLFCTVVSAQQPKGNNGVIRGTITTSDGKPAPYVSVKIEHSKLGAVTNEKGQFTIKNIAPGNRLIKVTAVGATAQEKAVTVEAGQTLQVEFVLNANASQLQEVVVLNRNLNNENRIVAKMPLNTMLFRQKY